MLHVNEDGVSLWLHQILHRSLVQKLIFRVFEAVNEKILFSINLQTYFLRNFVNSF